MKTLAIKNNNIILIILSLFLLTLVISGVVIDGITSSLRGFVQLQIHPARLINDFIEISGIGGAFFNAVIVGLIGIILVLITGIKFSGPTYAAILTMTGFGLFGKTPMNILPIILGVYFAALAMNKTFKDYIIIALFGTALGPVVSMIAFEIGLPIMYAIPVSIIGGVVTGFILPSLAIAMLSLHQGFNLYNMGLTCGFFGLFAFAIIKGVGANFSASFFWFENSSIFLIIIIPIFSLLLIILGIVIDLKKSIKSFIDIQKLPGQLPSDFVDMEELSGALINSGLIGIIASLYIFIVDGSFNGPVIGGLLTIMGFGAFGTHLRNSWPVVLGVIVATLVSGNSLNSPGPILAFIFCTTLAPVAGEFGIIAGFSAGFIHLMMVLQTGAWNGGINLYNNGFAGGLTAALIVSIIQWYRSNRRVK